MAYPAPSTKTFVLRARRETVLLVAATTAATFALSYAIRSHRPESRMEASALQAWTGELADIKMSEMPTGTAPITSASLVVPESQFALPEAPVRALVRLHGCDGSLCTTRAAFAPSPPRRPIASAGVIAAQTSLATKPRQDKPSLISRLNPLNHLPDVGTLKKPFAVAGDTVTGWFKRF